MERRVWSVECEARSVEWRAWSVEGVEFREYIESGECRDGREC